MIADRMTRSQIRDSVALLLAEQDILLMDLRNLMFRKLHGLFETTRDPARNAQRQWLVRLMRSANTLTTQSGFATVVFERGQLLPDLAGNLDHLRADSEFLVVFNPDLKTTRILLAGLILRLHRVESCGIRLIRRLIRLHSGLLL